MLFFKFEKSSEKDSKIMVETNTISIESITIYTPWETVQELYGEGPVPLEDEESCWSHNDVTYIVEGAEETDEDEYYSSSEDGDSSEEESSDEESSEEETSEEEEWSSEEEEWSSDEEDEW
tara:strand:+ start:119 stop:481 length:363 start_codon:yes stop_codon:yes gene_type:complete